MDKNAIKKYAVWARNELIERVTQKAEQYEITEENTTPKDVDSIGGRILSETEKKQRIALIEKIETDGFEQVIEEVAYTWFNRFTALRFMEINGYLPSHVRVFTNDEGVFRPQILTEAIHLELNGINMDIVYELKNADKNEELFKYLLITQCNALSDILPGMFQKIADYTELLLPDYLLREGSVIEQMIALIPEEDWTDQVQIIGWLYQYYNSEPKDAVFAALKKNVKISKESIPAATQLFTPDWIVRYMVENSLGRLWLEEHPNDDLKTEWKYYLDEAEQDGDVKKQLDDIRDKYVELKPEEIRCIDPCMGSGHILCYMFDVLVKIYEDYGYTAREAAGMIVEKNLWGLDIDERASQLSYFAVMMKARQYDRRFFNKKDENGEMCIPQPHIYAIEESNGISSALIHDMGIGLSEDECGEAIKEASRLLEEMHDAKEYGSIVHVTPCDWNLLRRFAIPKGASEKQMQLDVHGGIVATEKLQKLISIGETLTQKYHIVCTNPPYMSNRGMSDKMLDFVKNNYASEKSDMFSVFTRRCDEICANGFYYSLITQPSILFLSSFEELRIFITKERCIQSIIHMGRGIFGIDFGSTSFVIRKLALPSFRGEYFRLHERTFQYIEPEDIERLYINAVINEDATFNFSTYVAKDGMEDTDNSDSDETEASGKELKLRFSTKQDNFSRLPGCPFAYWASDAVIDTFGNKRIKDIASPRQGMATGENNRFLRLWSEVSIDKCGFGYSSREEAANSGKKWFPYNKGGDFRKWYGNNEYFVNWENDGYEICNFKDSKGKLRSRPQNTQFYFKPSLTWSFVSSTSFGVRYSPKGALFDIGGSSVFPEEKDMFYILGFLGSKLSFEYMKIQNPTMNFQVGNVANLPIIVDEKYRHRIDQLVKHNVEISKDDWDSFETSWEFLRHPLVPFSNESEKLEESQFQVDSMEKNGRLSLCFENWKMVCEDRFSSMKKNEEELNEIFIDIYNLQDVIGPEIDDKSVTIRKANLQRDIRSLLSYAVGCMFGRYSLDCPGLAFAGGTWDKSKYESFQPDKDSIIPVCDDEYFEDDIVGRFEEFMKVAYGDRFIEDNLKFVADALGGKGTPREVIRNYFLNDFFADHLKTYQKRPIYWLFDSGKKNGFKCLVYIHRYHSDTIARIRTDYVHEQQSRYHTAIENLKQRINATSSSEKVVLTKKLQTLQSQETEIKEYEEKIHHLADQMISIDLDDGVKHNYDCFKEILAKIR